MGEGASSAQSRSILRTNLTVALPTLSDWNIASPLKATKALSFICKEFDALGEQGGIPPISLP